MSNSTIAVGFLLLCYATGCGPRSTYKPERPNPQIQIRITGTGLSKMRGKVYSKGLQKIGWLLDDDGGPAQEIYFQNQDTVNYLAPIGMEEANEYFDSTAIGHDETLIFKVKIEQNKRIKSTSSNGRSANLKVELLANGQVVKAVQVPAKNQLHKIPSPNDSIATFSFNTSQL